MADYDYKAGKQRLEEILDNDMEVVEQDKLPNYDDFTFTNGYYSWVSAIFVDMRDSTELCADEDKEKLAKVFRSFSSEIIEILRDDANSHFLRTAGPHFPDNPGHIKRTALETSRTERRL